MKYLAAAAAMLASTAIAQTPQPLPVREASDVVVNMHDVDLGVVAEQISRITGRTIVLDPSVKGVVDVTSAEPLTSTGVWELFQSVLRVHGFATVRSGRIWRVVPQESAIRGGAVGGPARGQDVVTRLIRLRNLSPDTAARVFKPLIASFGSVEALTQPNAIVVTDYADNVRRIEQLAASLDGGGGAEFQTVVLSHAAARDVAQSVSQVLGDGGPRVVADERSNIVLIRGTGSGVAEAVRMIRLLDQPGGAAPITRVFELNNANAETLTEVLSRLMGSQGSASNAVARSLSSDISASDRGGNGFGGQFGSAAAATALALQSGSSGPPLSVGSVNTPSVGGSSLGSGFGSTSRTAGSAGFTTPDLSIQAVPELNSIVARGTPSAIAALEPLVRQLDKRRPQVLIEAAIVEVSGDVGEQLGIQLGFGPAAASGLDGAATSFSDTGPSLRSILQTLGVPASIGLSDSGFSGSIGDGNNFRIFVQALATSSKANLLSTPSITTLDNEPAEIVVGQNVPFRTGSFTTSGNTTNPFTTIERQDVGITLKVIPRVHQGNVVRLQVAQEVSSLVNTTIAGAADLITNRRSIQTTVLADDGETIALGGLITDDRQSTRSKVPVLGDIPIVGVLFRTQSENQTKRTLFVFLRPTILRDKEAARAATAAKYARVRAEELSVDQQGSLLIRPPAPRLTAEISGVY